MGDNLIGLIVRNAKEMADEVAVREKEIWGLDPSHLAAVPDPGPAICLGPQCPGFQAR